MPSDASAIYRQGLEKKLEKAIVAAIPLAIAGKFESAEDKVRHAELPFSEGGSVARMYVRAIASLDGVNADPRDRERIREMFSRMIYRPVNPHPEPHTQEEADRYGQEDAREHARVVKLVGFDPTEWPVALSSNDNQTARDGMRSTPSRKKVKHMLTTILAVVAMLLSMSASLMMVVMFLAGGANSSPVKMTQIKMLIASVVFVQLLSLGGSIGLLIVDRGWLACGAGLLPTIYAIALSVVLLIMKW